MVETEARLPRECETYVRLRVRASRSGSPTVSMIRDRLHDETVRGALIRSPMPICGLERATDQLTPCPWQASSSWKDLMFPNNM